MLTHTYTDSHILLIGSDAVETLSIRESNHKSSTIGRIKSMATKNGIYFPSIVWLYAHTQTHTYTKFLAQIVSNMGNTSRMGEVSRGEGERLCLYFEGTFGQCKLNSCG